MTTPAPAPAAPAALPLPYAPASSLAGLDPALVAGVAPERADRLLRAASDLLDATVISPYSTDTDGIPTDPRTAAALAAACVHQVEFWMRVGEDDDIDGPTVGQVGKLKIDTCPPTVAPRAMRTLRNAGLMRSYDSTFGAAGGLENGFVWGSR